MLLEAQDRCNMADVKKLIPIIIKWESDKYTENPGDKGGPTKDGITLATWQNIGYDKNHDGHIDKEDVKLIEPSDYEYVLRSYWNTWKADQINNQSIANILVDFVWASGSWGVIKIQQLLGLKADGVVGPKTLFAVNNFSTQDLLFNQIKQVRKTFVANIILAHPDQKKWERGWLNRINSFTFSENFLPL